MNRKIWAVLALLLPLSLGAETDGTPAAPAAEPKAEVVVVTFTGEASAGYGLDLDTQSGAFTNAAKVELELKLAGTGAKSAAEEAEGFWTEFTIVAKNDPDNSNDDHFSIELTNGVWTGTDIPTMEVETAKIHYGKLAYLSLLAGNTYLNYALFGPKAAPVFTVDRALRYGQVNSGATVAAEDSLMPGLPTNRGLYGVELGLTLEKLLAAKLGFRSNTQWNEASGAINSGATADLVGTGGRNAYGLKFTLAYLGLENLTLEAATVAAFADPAAALANYRPAGFGGLAAYKLGLGEKAYLMPHASFDMAYGDAGWPLAVAGGVVYGWGDKGKTPDLYFFPEVNSTDFGYYPGVSVGVLYRNLVAENFSTLDLDGNPRGTLGLNLSFLSGDLIGGVKAAAALELRDLFQPMYAAEAGNNGEISGSPWALALAGQIDLAKEGDFVIVPKGGLHFATESQIRLGTGTDYVSRPRNDLFLKLGVDLKNLLPNLTLSFDYASNDLLIDSTANSVDRGIKAGTPDADGNSTGAQTFGRLLTTAKLSF